MNPRVKRLTRAEQQQETRLALVDAAIELFIERGVDATSIEEITAEAGFSRGAFYSNFESKDALFLAACRRFLERLHAAARPGPDDALDDAGRAYAERMQRLRAVTRDRGSMFLAEITLYAIRHPALAEAVGVLHQEQLAPAMAFVRDAMASAGIEGDATDVAQLANVMQSLTFGLHLFGTVDPAIEPETALAAATDLMFKGLAASATGVGTRSAGRRR